MDNTRQQQMYMPYSEVRAQKRMHCVDITAHFYQIPTLCSD